MTTLIKKVYQQNWKVIKVIMELGGKSKSNMYLYPETLNY